MSSFYLCFVKTRKKIDKYFKVNKIRNKYVIDIKKILEEEKMKDVYYIPNFYNPQLDVIKLLELKNVLSEEQNFNLLLFFEEFVGTNWLNTVLEELDSFSHSQIIKNY